MAQTWVKRGNLGAPDAVGSGSVGALALGATADIVCPLNRTMPNANYKATASLAATTLTLLGAVSVQGISAQTTTSVTVRVKATAALATGVTVNVIAKL